MNLRNLSVPDGWKLSTVGKSYAICNNLREPISTTVRQEMQGVYPYYGPTDVLDYLDHYRVEGKYALIGEDGDHFLKFNDRPMTLLVNGKFNVNNHAHLVQEKGHCTTEWFYYFFMHTSVKPFLTRQGAGRFKLNKAALQKLPILIPPIEEQRKIAEILSTWDEAIRLTQELIAAKEQRKKGLMQRLLTGQVRFAGFEERPEKQETRFGLFPAEWEMVHLEDVAKINAKSLSNKTKPDKTFHYIDLSAVNKGEIAFPTETITFAKLPSRARRILRNGDVIMATVRPNLLAYSICDFEPKDVLCSTGFALISPKTKADSQFIYQSLYSDLIQRQLHGLVTGSNYPAVNSSEVAKLIFTWPKHDAERHRIAAVLQACDHEIHLLQQKLAALQQQKKGLMQRLLTGQLRVVPGKGQ